MRLRRHFLRCRTVDKVAKQLYKAGKIKDLCEDADFFTRLTKLEAQYPNASVLVHKQGVLPPEIANLWSSPVLMSAARQFLGGDLALLLPCFAHDGRIPRHTMLSLL